MDFIKFKSTSNSANGASERDTCWNRIFECNQGYAVFLLATIVWICLISRFQNGSNICQSPVVFSDWTRFVNVAEFSIFFINAMPQIPRLLMHDWKQSRSSLHLIRFAALAINLMAGFSSLLSFLFHWGGICEAGPEKYKWVLILYKLNHCQFIIVTDFFSCFFFVIFYSIVYFSLSLSSRSRLALPFTMWIEWLICVPLMGFVSVHVEKLRDLRRSDVAVVFLLLICILIGFCLNLQISQTMLYVIFGLASGCLLAVIIIFLQQSRVKFKVDVGDYNSETTRMNPQER